MLSLTTAMTCLLVYFVCRWRVRTRRSKKFVKVEEGFAPSAYLKATNESVDLDASDVKREMTPKDDAAISKDLKKKKE